MFVVAQFPLADARPFLPVETFRLLTPSFPLAVPNQEFLRFHGPVMARPRGGVREWSGEEVFSRAKRVLRLPRDGEGTELVRGFRFAFRRFFSDGLTVLRTEIGMVTRGRFLRDQHGLLAALADVLMLRVAIPELLPESKQMRWARVKLHEAGPCLAAAYLRASTAGTRIRDQQVQKWWVEDGAPLLLVECRPREADAVPKHARHIATLTSLGIELVHYWVQCDGKRLSTWILSRSPGADLDTLRRLRVHLLRLHAEQESLRQVLRWLSQKKIEVDPGSSISDDLQQYLSDTLRRITREKHSGLPAGEIFDAALDYEELVHEGARATLLEQLGKMRLNLRRNLERYTAARSSENAAPKIIINPKGDVVLHQTQTITLGAGVVIHGNFTAIVARHVENAFNKADKSAADAELKEKLKELTTLIAKATSEMPAGKAEEASRDLETLVTEVTSPKPRKKFYEVSADGLIEAAKTCATMAGPVTSAVKAVLSLLT